MEQVSPSPRSRSCLYANYGFNPSSTFGKMPPPLLTDSTSCSASASCPRLSGVSGSRTGNYCLVPYLGSVFSYLGTDVLLVCSKVKYSGPLTLCHFRLPRSTSSR